MAVNASGKKEGLTGHTGWFPKQSDHHLNAVDPQIHETAVGQFGSEGIFYDPLFVIVVAGGILAVLEEYLAYGADLVQIFPDNFIGRVKNRARCF